MQLNLRSTDVKRIVEHGAYLYYFTAAGVEAYDPVTRARQAYADVANTTCGAVNTNGVYIGTSDAGVYLLTFAAITAGGNQTGAVVSKFKTTTTPALTSDVVHAMHGEGKRLALGLSNSITYTLDSAATTIFKCLTPDPVLKVFCTRLICYYVSGGVVYMSPPLGYDWSFQLPLNGTGPALTTGQQVFLLGYPTSITGGWGTSQRNYVMHAVIIGTKRYVVLNDENAANTFGGFGAWCVTDYSTGAMARASFPAGMTISVTSKIHAHASGYVITTHHSSYTYLTIRTINPDTNAISAAVTTQTSSVNGKNISDAIFVFAASSTMFFAGVSYWDGYVTQTGIARYTRSGAVLSQSGWVELATSYSFFYGRGAVETLGNYMVVVGSISGSVTQVVSINMSSLAVIKLPTTSNMHNLSNMSDNGYFVVHATGSSTVPLWYHLNKDTGAITYVCSTNLPSTGYCKASMHPSGTFCLITNSFNTGRYMITFNGVSCSYSAYSTGIPSFSYAASTVFISNNLFLSLQYNTSDSRGVWGLHQFTYEQDFTPLLGDAVNDIFGFWNSSTVGFCTTDGIMLHDGITYLRHTLTGLFGSSNNVVCAYVATEITATEGILAYGTNDGVGGGQLGIINLRNQYTLATRPGDMSVVWNSGLEVVCYNDQMERIEDAVSSTKKLVLLGTAVKSIVKHGQFMFHFTDAGVDVHRIVDGVRVCWASQNAVTCGAVNDQGVYLGTNGAGVRKLSMSNLAVGGDQTASLLSDVVGTTSNNITCMSAIGDMLLVGSLSTTLSLFISEVRLNTTLPAYPVAVAVDVDRIAYATTTAVYHRSVPSANWVYDTSATLVGELVNPAINTIKFGADLFIGTDGGVTVVDTYTDTYKHIAAAFGLNRNIVAIHPTTQATKGTGLLAYGIDLLDGTGKFGVLDLSTVA